MGDVWYRGRRRAAAGIAAALVVAAVITFLALHDDGGSSPGWATQCFQAWDDRQHINARPDSAPVGLSSHAVAKFARSHAGIPTVIAKHGRCIDDWIDSITQAHFPPRLLVAFDRTDHVAAAWFVPGRSGVVSRPAR